MVSRPASAGDPWLSWYTVETPHFRVTYPGGLETEARRVATLAELVQRRISEELAWRSRERTEILITDDVDAANGSATALPYNLVRMFVSAPDDMSVLGDYDDWLLTLLTHEHTHVAHLDTMGPLPGLINAILGKTLAPNQVQPRWIVEGLAVALESEHTTGGRIRSTQFDMYLRADVLEGRLATLDQISHPARRWPAGNLWYLYGGRFVHWIASTYGADVWAAVARDYGDNPIPWGINRSIRRATGRTYPELWEAWHAALRRRYEGQLAEVDRRGRIEGRQLTRRGRNAGGARFLPRCAARDRRAELAWFRDDGDTTPGIWRMPLSNAAESEEREAELWVRTTGRSVAFDGECGLVFEATAPSRRRYLFNDLFRQPPGTRSPRGNERTRERLTTGRRARDVDVSPDGRSFVFVENHRGTSTLHLSSRTDDGALARGRVLWRGDRWDQAFTPRFSPDGRLVAFSLWRRGGHRDVAVLSLSDGLLRLVTKDRALDQQPSFSPDGRWLLFTSDRTGIANVYAFGLADGSLHQVTNVRTGAYYPEVSPDGSLLVYTGYTSRGFDLFALPFERDRWLPAQAPEETRAPAPVATGEVAFRPRPYTPWRTLRPRSYSVDLTTGPFGDQLVVSTAAQDLVGHHGIAAAVGADFTKAEPVGTVSYTYGRLPAALRVGISRSASLRRGRRIGDQELLVVERFTGVSSGLSLSEPGLFEGQVVSLGYTAGSYDSRLPLGTLGNPYSPVPREPHRGFLGLVRLHWSYASVEGTAEGISTERGLTAAVGLDLADRALGSDDTLFAVGGRVTGYVPMPWAAHHVLAVGVSGASAGGTYPRRGLYYTGGFDPRVSVLDAFTDGVVQGGFVLRGYQPGQFVGQTYNLVNVEYRFPLWHVDRGLSTLPAFLRSLSLATFADWGGAYDVMDLEAPFESFHTGVGTELWLDVVLGYQARAILRLGVARGLDSEAPGTQAYLVASTPF